MSLRHRIEAGFTAWGRFVVQRRWWVILACILLSAGLMSRLGEFRVDNSDEAFLHADDPERVRYDRFKQQFDREDRIMVLLHPGEDLHDGVTFERFLETVENHARANILYDPSHFVLQQLDYLSFIDIYHERIKMFHVKDAEFRSSGRSGVYGGFQDWVDRPGRFRSLGDGQIDFKAIFSRLTACDFEGWAVLEWECCLKHQEDGAREGAEFIEAHIIRVTDRAFDDFASAGASDRENRDILGLD